MTLFKTLSLCAAALMVSAVSVAKELPPVGGKPSNFVVPETRQVSLDNGLKVTFIPYGTTPKATVRLVTHTGNIDDGGKIWLSDLSFEMLRQGTANQSAQALATSVASMGGQIDTSVGLDSSWLGTDVLSEFADDAVAVIADMVLNANFDESDLARIKVDRQRELDVAKSRPSSKATEAFYHKIYGNHPYGQLYPTQESLASITAEETAAFVATNLVPNRSHLYVSGVFDEAAVLAAVKSAFGEWQAGAEPQRKTVLAQAGPSVTVIDRPDAPQSTLRLGLATFGPGHKDAMTMNVMNTLLGGAFSSRITSNIREDKGYTYSPRSSVMDRVGTGFWYQGADVTAEATAASLSEIVKEINLLANEHPSEKELTGVKNYMAGIFVLRNSSRGAIISQLAFTELHGLDASYLQTYVDKIYATTPAEVSNVVKQYLDVSKMHLVVVGDEADVKAQLATLDGLFAL